MSKWFWNRAPEGENDIPAFAAISEEILRSSVFKNAVSPENYTKFQDMFESAKGDRIAMAKCMREIKGMMITLKTAFFPTDEVRQTIHGYISQGEWYKAYQAIVAFTHSEDRDIHFATKYIQDEETKIAIEEAKQQVRDGATVIEWPWWNKSETES